MKTKAKNRKDVVAERTIFACLVMMVVGGTLAEFLKDKSDEERAFYARIWDEQKSVPVGILFAQPKF